MRRRRPPFFVDRALRAPAGTPGSARRRSGGAARGGRRPRPPTSWQVLGGRPHRLLEQGQQQLVLAREVLVEAAQRLAGALDHVLDGELLAGVVLHQLERGVEEALHPLLGPGALPGRATARRPARASVPGDRSRRASAAGWFRAMAKVLLRALPMSERDLGCRYRRYARTSSRSSGVAPAVDADDLAGDVARPRRAPGTRRRRRCPRAARPGAPASARRGSRRPRRAGPWLSDRRSIGVSMNPGGIVLTVMPFGPSSSASALVNPITPALDAT